MESVRWVFRVAGWRPTKDQWTRAISCVQEEERARINRFHFQRDAKSALIGRLLLRRVIHHTVKLPYPEILLGRTDKGKPYLVNLPDAHRGFNFNVSHQGDYVVMVANTRDLVGVDVMNIHQPRGKSVADFFKTMDRQFTENEWKIIKEPVDTWEQLKHFYRFWCLKESYVKALGVGIGFSLDRLDFRPQSAVPPGGDPCCDTRVAVDGDIQTDWAFHEMMVDDQHSVAVALQKRAEGPWAPPQLRFTFLGFEDVINGMSSVAMEDPRDWELFSQKPLQPQSS